MTNIDINISSKLYIKEELSSSFLEIVHIRCGRAKET